MLDYLIEENSLAPVLSNFGIGQQQINLIKACIIGIQPEDGRKGFLYQIVNNDHSGLDVDKWDYFLRDCLYLGLPCNFEYERLMQFAKVFMIDGRNQICFRDKVLESVCNVFRTRSNLHRLAYQHKVVVTAERMFLDAFKLADGRIASSSGKPLYFWEWSMSAAFSHDSKLRKALEQFCMLTDSVVFSCLKYHSQPELQKTIELIKAVETRSCKKSGFYRHVGLKIISNFCDEEEIMDGLCQFLPTANERIFSSDMSEQLHKENFIPVTRSDICVCVVPINWGKGARNPVEFVQFYSKDSTFSKSVHLEVSAMLPKTFEEVQVHVLCRRSDDNAFHVTKWCFESFWISYCKKNGLL